VTSSPTPRRIRSPKWLDVRLIAGIGLVLVSVLIGVKVVTSADKTDRVWAASHDLAPGAVLRAGDLAAVAVRLPDPSARYFLAATDLIGQTLTRQLDAGELLPRSAVGASGIGTTVVVPLGDDNAPKILAGQRITVWVSTKSCPAAVVLADVTVQDVQSARGGSFAAGGADIIVRVSAEQALRVIQALALDGGVLRAGVLHGAQSTSTTALDNLSSCVAVGS
jgi:hypothetical protein